MADEVKDEKVNPFAAEAEAENKKRSGVGLRVFTGFTRGKGSMAIKWEQFADDSEPKDLQEFINITKSDKDDILKYAIVGFNDAKYTEASDPIAEHLNKNWDDALQAQFRLTVRNLHKALAPLGLSIEDVVAQIKPGVEKAFAAKAK